MPRKKNDYAEQIATKQEVANLLKKKHKCAILRPTGFGKTFLLTDIIHDYKRVLYIYPSAVIRDTVITRYASKYMVSDDEEECGEIDQETIETAIAMKQIDHCDLMTYALLARLPDSEIERLNYDLFIFDECHKMGAPKTRLACEKLFASHPKARFAGATATPTRADNIDVVSLFFSNITPYTYTLFDAIENGLLKKPTYCYCTYDVEADLRDAALTAGQDITDDETATVLKQKALEISKMCNIPNVIKDVCNTYAKTTSYMKFIAFFASKKAMDDGVKDVTKWLHEAYPKHTINILKISSKTKEESENTSKLSTLVPKKNRIDVIACIDMLNLGYHINNLTGVMMCRYTTSNIIFVQQLGRALSVGAENSSLVFDIVDNLHRKAVFELKQNLSDKRHTYSDRKVVSGYVLMPDNKIGMNDGNGNVIPTQYHLTKDGEIIDASGNVSSLVYEDGIIYDDSESHENMSTITSDMLFATGHIATYKELLAKAIAESLVQRCKYALELHFRTWCHNHNVPYPISEKELKKLYGLDKDEFYSEFCNILKKHKIAYPLQDAEKLISMGGDDVPLRICAEARQISMDTLLRLMFEQTA